MSHLAPAGWREQRAWILRRLAWLGATEGAHEWGFDGSEAATRAFPDGSVLSSREPPFPSPTTREDVLGDLPGDPFRWTDTAVFSDGGRWYLYYRVDFDIRPDPPKGPLIERPLPGAAGPGLLPAPPFVRFAMPSAAGYATYRYVAGPAWAVASIKALLATDAHQRGRSAWNGDRTLALSYLAELPDEILAAVVGVLDVDPSAFAATLAHLAPDVLSLTAEGRQ